MTEAEPIPPDELCNCPYQGLMTPVHSIKDCRAPFVTPEDQQVEEEQLSGSPLFYGKVVSGFKVRHSEYDRERPVSVTITFTDSTQVVIAATDYDVGAGLAVSVLGQDTEQVEEGQ